MLRSTRLVLVVAIAGLSVLMSSCALVVKGSVSDSGNPGSDGSYVADLSADGRFLVFTSFAPNLVPNDNSLSDVFVRDLVTGTIERVSIGDDEQDGTGPNGDNPLSHFGQAYPDAISADGRYVLFSSYSKNLVANVDDNQVGDLFVRDRVAGTTKLVSVATDGTSGDAGTYAGGSMSNDGRYVVFTSNATDLVPGANFGNQLYVRDLQLAVTTKVLLPSFVFADAWNATVSGDGNVIAFNSAYPLVPGDLNDGVDTFTYDRSTAQVDRVSVDSNENEVAATGGNAPLFNDVAISDDGSVVAFVTPHAGLVPSDDNNANDVFVRDRDAGTTERVSVSTSGAQATGASGTGPTTQGSVDLDSTGRRVTFVSEANDLVAGDTGRSDVFVRDRRLATTTRVSTDFVQRELNEPSTDAVIDGGGRIVAFTSAATNVGTSEPYPGVPDVYLRSSIIPKVSSVSPANGSRGAQPVLTIHGSGFLPGAVPSISGTGVAVGSVIAQDEEMIQVAVTIAADASLTARNVTVTLPAIGPGAVGLALNSCGGCFTVTS